MFCWCLGCVWWSCVGYEVWTMVISLILWLLHVVATVYFDNSEIKYIVAQHGRNKHSGKEKQKEPLWVIIWQTAEQCVVWHQVDPFWEVMFFRKGIQCANQQFQKKGEWQLTTKRGWASKLCLSAKGYVQLQGWRPNNTGQKHVATTCNNSKWVSWGVE